MNLHFLIASLGACIALALSLPTMAQDACTKIGFGAGQPDPNRCYPVVEVDRADWQPAVNAARAHADAGDAHTLRQALAYADERDARTLDAATQHTAATAAGLRRKAFAGIAQAAALSSLDPEASGQTTLNMGLASYRGQTALGFVLAHRTGDTTFSAGAAAVAGKSRTLVRVTAGWRF